MPLYEDVKEKVVLVTGGANGIGAATVKAFQAQGARVHFCDLETEAGKRMARAVPGARFTRVDLSRERDISKWIQAIARENGRIDVLVNNAAIDPRISISDLSSAKFEAIMNVNVRALFLAAREALPHMSRGAGAIINLSSITFHTGPLNMSAYVASKAAVIGFTRSLAREVGPRGIRVNTVSPGWIMTQRQLRDYVNASTKKLIRRSQCIPDLIQPEEIAEIVLFLGCNASRAITGQEILADRGWAYS